MTWGEFKKWCEERGVQDTDRIGFFDFDGDPIVFDRTESIGTPMHPEPPGTFLLNVYR